MYYYLAFDQASGTTGYSIFTDDGLVKYGKFSTKGHDFLEKVTETCDFIEGIVKEFQERGKVEVHLEDIQLQANAKTYKQLAQLQGSLCANLVNGSILFAVSDISNAIFPGVNSILSLISSRLDRKSTRLNSSHSAKSRMPSSA